MKVSYTKCVKKKRSVCSLSALNTVNILFQRVISSNIWKRELELATMHHVLKSLWIMDRDPMDSHARALSSLARLIVPSLCVICFWWTLWNTHKMIAGWRCLCNTIFIIQPGLYLLIAVLYRHLGIQAHTRTSLKVWVHMVTNITYKLLLIFALR